MNKNERQAREAMILDLIALYPYLAQKADRALTNAYIEASADSGLEAVRQAVHRFRMNQVVGHPPDREPSAPKFGDVARRIDAGLQIASERARRLPLPPAPKGTTRLPSGALAVPVGVPFDWENGILPDGDTINYGRGTIALGGLTRAEAELVDRCKGVTKDGRSMSGMSADAIRSAITPKRIAPPEQARRIEVRPRKMT
jgi:hypothetical protein